MNDAVNRCAGCGMDIGLPPGWHTVKVHEDRIRILATRTQFEMLDDLLAERERAEQAEADARAHCSLAVDEANARFQAEAALLKERERSERWNLPSWVSLCRSVVMAKPDDRDIWLAALGAAIHHYDQAIAADHAPPATGGER